jgi:DNA mismatch repair protein MutS2
VRRSAASADEIEEAVEDAGDLVARTAPAPPPRVAPPRPVKVGDRVHLRSLGSVGTVAALTENSAEVEVGRLRVRAALEELNPAAEDRPTIPSRKGATPASLAAPAPPMEVDVRGLTVDEAMDVIDRQLDAAAAAGMPFLRIIHGKGTGRLRQAVRRAMQDSPYAVGFERGGEAEGGEGVTIVRLAMA